MSAAIDVRHSRCSRQTDRASELWRAIVSVRAPRRTALGTVRAATSTIGTAASASETQAAGAGTSPLAISVTIAAIVASITVAISRFIGRAAVVTRA